MKRQQLISKLHAAGCVLMRHGSRHDLYHNPETGATQPVPRHSEINEVLAKRIIRTLTTG
jgi:mRNA interferase HicA